MILERLLEPWLALPPAPLAEVATPLLEYLARDGGAQIEETSSCERAFVAGLSADCIGHAFAAGYQAAMRATFPSVDGLAAFAVTEAGGGHPRAMQTRVRWMAEHAELDGEKNFVTLGEAAAQLLVVVRDGDDDQARPRLRVARVPSDAPGLSFQPGPTLPMLPEITHARVRLTAVPIPRSAVLPGDGYLDYVKPFRTVEDIHVHSALVGHLLRLTRAYALPAPLFADLLGYFVQLRGLAAEPAHAATTHLALGAAQARFEQLLTTHEAALHDLPEPIRQRTERDLAIRFVAQKARQARFEAASKQLGLP